MIGSRFAILTYGAPGDLLNASCDSYGRPGSWQEVGIPEDAVITSVVVLPCPMESTPEGFRLLVTYNYAEPPKHLLRDLENQRSGYLVRIEAQSMSDTVQMRCEGCGSFVDLGIHPSFEEVEAAVAFHRANAHGQGSA